MIDDTDDGDGDIKAPCSNGGDAVERAVGRRVLATPDFPTFMEIAEAAEDNLIVLEGFLVDPHPPMPDLSLTRQEIRDLIGYFATLR